MDKIHTRSRAQPLAPVEGLRTPSNSMCACIPLAFPCPSPATPTPFGSLVGQAPRPLPVEACRMRPPSTVASPPALTLVAGPGEKAKAKQSRAEGCRSCSGSSAMQSGGRARPGSPAPYFARRVRWRGAERHVASCLAPCSPGARERTRARPPAMVLSSIFSSHELDVSGPWGPGLDATRPALFAIDH